jgi:hypothetical protein
VRNTLRLLEKRSITLSNALPITSCTLDNSPNSSGSEHPPHRLFNFMSPPDQLAPEPGDAFPGPYRHYTPNLRSGLGLSKPKEALPS